MQSEIFDIISIVSEDTNTQLPNKFELQYYSKMSYSGVNKILEMDKILLRKNISFEVAFVHVIIYVFNKNFNADEDYHDMVAKFDIDNLFSWYKMSEDFLYESLCYLNELEFSNIYEIVNLHDTFIDKDIKKKLGQFYTPNNIVKHMISDIKKDLRNLKNTDYLIDPACGTGIFLIEFILELKNYVCQTIVFDYIKKNLFACDVNPFAVIATKINIIYFLLREFPEEKLKILDWIIYTNKLLPNIQWKNTIIEQDNNRYAIILGNPPYFKLNNNLIKDISGYDEILYGQPNIYSFFMFWGIQHLKEDGVMSLIVPQSIRSGLYFKKLRSKMKDLRIRSLINIDSRQNVFDRAEQAVLIICLENKAVANSKTKIQFYDGNGQIKNEFKIPRSKLMMNEDFNHIFIVNKSINMYGILDKVYSNSRSLDCEQTKLRFSTGLFVWNQHKNNIVDFQADAIPIIYGGNIQLTGFDFSICSSNPERKQYAIVTEKTKSYVLGEKRLIIQRTTNFDKNIRLKPCLISDEFLEEHDKYFLENHVNYLCGSEEKDMFISTEQMYYYLGLLNSRIINYIFASKSGNTQVSANELNTLPFPKEDYCDLSHFVSKHVDKLKEYQDELDILVCNTYGLSKDETDFILNY